MNTFPSKKGILYTADVMYRTTISANVIYWHHVLPVEALFPVGGGLSRGVCVVAPTALADFDIQKNGVSIGTMRFAAGANVCAFIVPTSVTFKPGDVMRMIAPGVMDTTLSGMAHTLIWLMNG